MTIRRVTLLLLLLALPPKADGQALSPRPSPSIEIRPAALTFPREFETILGAVAVDSVEKNYNWGAGFIGAGVGAAVGVGAGLLIHSSQDVGEKSPLELITFGVLGAIVGFFVGLGLGNR